MAIVDRVKALVVEGLGVDADEVNPEARLADDLGADPMDRTELFMACEEEFGFELPDVDAEGIVTVQDLINCVLRYAGYN